ncbi:hypothetical protein GCM10011360_28060 [Primorskyibacter flagellatus]|uniref:Acyltransferase 3 domain-containing protein n=1 Tax=Primorskyibacter flagellatus TaxID=1387277 RepID=A0A917ACR0_9RHOB|nr:acyltransferase [Primorskyibacter flagellatus]GGE38677.1 hypothetical protein GCM10011360_28060 [Primorskyibacter flagellatus]
MPIISDLLPLRGRSAGTGNHLPSSGAGADRIRTDTLRGIACIGVVLFHVAGNTETAGLRLSDDHWLRLFNAVFADIRMPLFAFLSGYVFLSVTRRTGQEPPWSALRTKARRLLLPMACVGSLFWMMQGGGGPGWPGLLVLPHAHFWFLQAIFLVMSALLLTGFLSGGRHVPAALALGAVCALAWCGVLPRPEVNVFSVIEATYLGLFFCTGFLCAARPEPFTGRAGGHIAGAVALSAAVLAGAGLTFLPEIVPGAVLRPVRLMIGLSGVLGLLALGLRSPLAAKLGRHAYAVFLFHVFFTAGTRETIQAVMPGIPAEAIILPGLVAGLAGPVLLEKGLLRVPVLRMMMLGIRPVSPRTGTRGWVPAAAPRPEGALAFRSDRG